MPFSTACLLQKSYEVLRKECSPAGQCLDKLHRMLWIYTCADVRVCGYKLFVPTYQNIWNTESVQLDMHCISSDISRPHHVPHSIVQWLSVCSLESAAIICFSFQLLKMKHVYSFIFSTLYVLPTLMHNSLVIKNMYVTLLSSTFFEH